MPQEIGETAGKVWNQLSGGGATRMVTLLHVIPESRDQVQRAIGWLAREDKVIIERQNGSEFIRLK